MKKMIALLIAASMVFSLTACGKKQDKGPKIESALALLTTVWDSYGEEEKFPAGGGDFSEENMSMEGPGKFGLEDVDALDSVLAVPETAAPMIDDAASLVHMMNANTFTAGAYHVATGNEVSALADALKENIMARQWICGFPEKLIIITVGEYVVCGFGNGELMDTFKEKVSAAYETAEVLYEEPLM